MDFEIFCKEFDEKLMAFTKRLDVNYIVGTSTVFDEVTNAKSQVDALLEYNAYNKIQIKEVIILNDINKNDTQKKENDDMSQKLKELLHYLDTEVEKFAKEGAFGYVMNSQFKDIIRFVDLKKEEMNYDSWLKLNSTKNNDNYFLVELEDDWYNYKTTSIDLLPLCNELIDTNFKFRKHLLQFLKNGIVNIFSTYLFLPEVKLLPKIGYTCTSTDVCEFILAITESSYFEENKELKPILTEMFNITDKQYTDARREINGKRKSRGQFLAKMLDSFNKKPKGKSN
ncbi:hypothetical protein [Lacibacter sediminis]|uniref:Uncharacterized protein n=1 Tax=Lacibacter sediminis TaxID=2760713 RepID=A0A7G5XK44_9BACT|nr:hypothetical protein [Lacibacter sediminis]QNA45847.1 hypothetical protein H4075_06545 [Lacibacter sediminis]